MECDCTACRGVSPFEDDGDMKEMDAMFEKALRELEARTAELHRQKMEEVADLAKGKAVIIGKELGEDIWADQHACGFVRLNEVERLLFSGQARKATRRELQALAT